MLKKNLLLIFTLFSFNIFIFSNDWTPRDKDLTNDINFYTYEDTTVAYKYFNKKEGQPVILYLYGFGGNIEMLRGIAPALADNYTVLTIDYPGHCYSPEPEVFSLKKYVETVDNLVNEHKIENIYLVGYSFGGVASLLFYEKNIKKIKKFVLLHSETNFSYNLFKRFFYTNFYIMLKANFKITLFYLAIPILRDKYFTDDLYELAKIIIMYNNPKNVIDNFTSIIYKNFDYLLDNIQCPALVIGSKVDFLISEKRSVYINSKIKNSELIIYEDIGHLSIVSKYNKVAEDILNFFNK